MIAIISAVLLQASALAPDQMKLIVERTSAMYALETCAFEHAVGMARQPDTAETLSRAAISLCRKDQEEFRLKSFESMRGRSDEERAKAAEEWVSARSEDIRGEIVNYIVDQRARR